MEGVEEWEVEKILNKRKIHEVNKYLVYWKRFMVENNTWENVTNFIQLVFPQPVDCISQTKLYWKAPNDSYLHIRGMYKSDNKQLRYLAISNCKSFVG